MIFCVSSAAILDTFVICVSQKMICLCNFWIIVEAKGIYFCTSEVLASTSSLAPSPGLGGMSYQESPPSLGDI